MRAFDLECFDLIDRSKLENRDPQKVRSENMQDQLLQEINQRLLDEIQSLREQSLRSDEELNRRRAEIADLKNQLENLVNRRDWRLLMKFNRLPGVAAIKRLLRWMLRD
jgi:septal ring factor EnvC (AmiA/AmiB activator)